VKARALFPRRPLRLRSPRGSISPRFDKRGYGACIARASVVFGLTHMDYNFYKIAHLIGISLLAIGVGGMLAGGEKRKTFVMVQGIGLLVMLVTGFGLLAKLKLTPYMPPFAIVKTALWLVIGMLPVLFRKLKTPLPACILISLILVGLMAYLGVVKPQLW
jgi:hypothetical protein